MAESGLSETLTQYLKRQERTYRPLPKGSDIFIVSYPKSGTSWVQMILYQLKTDGAMKIDHIGQKIPHLEETLFRSRTELNNLTPPWILKTHLPYSRIPRVRAKYIYVMRNGLDVAVSYYHHYERCIPNPPRSFSEFFKRFLTGDVAYGSWFTHVADWVENKNGLDMLLVKYEDMIRDLPGSIATIAAFCDLPFPSGERSRIIHNCSFEFMQQHDAIFDISRNRSNKGRFIRRGAVGEWHEYLDEAMLTDYIREFDRHIHLDKLRPFRPSLGTSAPGSSLRDS